MALRYFPAARKDIKDALKWSSENFGRAAAQRYKRLISVALSEIAANPKREHSYEMFDLQAGISLYHLRHSRKRAAVGGQCVRNPRHFVAYAIREADVLIVRVLHDRMEIAQQLAHAAMNEAPDPRRSSMRRAMTRHSRTHASGMRYCGFLTKITARCLHPLRWASASFAAASPRS
jgi:plasmid stabilization system protein ParE